MKRKFLAVILSVCLLFILVGCEGDCNIFIIESTTDEGYLLTVQVSYSSKDEKTLNSYAQFYVDENSPSELKSSDGQHWKISDYITSVVIYGYSNDYKILKDNGIKFKFVNSITESVTNSTEKINYQIYEALIPYDALSAAASAKSGDDAEEEAQSDYEYKSGFYINKYHFDMESPINGARENFDSASTYASRIIKYGAYKTESGTMYTNEGGALDPNDTLFIPKMEDAFSIIKILPASFNLDDIGIIYGFQNANTLRNTNAVVQTDEYGNNYYLFEEAFTAGEKRISYDIWRANSLGFNITALIVAALIIAAMFIASKYVKPKQKVPPIIYIPFDPKKIDPFEQSSIDPFDGYKIKEEKEKTENPFDGY